MAVYQNGYMRNGCMNRSMAMPNCGCQKEPVYQKDMCNTMHHHEEWGEFPIAMAYVPWQKWKNIYELDKGFHTGTIFEELDKPFLGRRACK